MTSEQGKHNERSNDGEHLPGDDFADLLANAKSGCEQSMNQLLDECHRYMLSIANKETQSQLRQKVGASDIVQQSLMNIESHIERFAGSTRKEFFAWMRGILINGIRENQRRYFQADKRAVGKEVAIDKDQSNMGLDFADSMFTPGTDASMNEEAEMLKKALSQLSDDDQMVIQLRVWEKMSFKEIAQKMERTEAAVQKLWSRSIVRLKSELEKLGAI